MKKLQHIPVLLKESVEQLIINKDGLYIDGTFGRGGHSREILSHLSKNGKLIAFDKDIEAKQESEYLKQQDKRFDFFHESFVSLENKCEELSLDGILIDLGISSPQIDNVHRGFSFMKDGPLDMRMDTSRGISAAQWLQTVEEKKLANVIWEYGEERFSRKIAKVILQKRNYYAIDTTKKLAQLVDEIYPYKEKGKHPATRTFQAIRIFINNELEDLKIFLEIALSKLKVGGRLVVISFHSLEDRIVKQFIHKHYRGDNFPINLPIKENQLNRRFKKVMKAQKPSEIEVKQNIRSRSAIMRIAEKID